MMQYENKEMTVNELISSFNQGRVDLIPPFQRGTVWNLKRRQKLMVSMLSKRPIPAIFFYMEAAGPQFVYNILDGKQRLESLILFIGDRREGLKIKNVQTYFFGKPAKKDANFKVEFNGKMQAFSDLDDEFVRAFRESRIPTIQISMEEEHTSLAELVSLFVDINSEGTPVSRFDVVKALLQADDPLFTQVFDLIAQSQLRKRKSRYYKAKNSNFVFVMKRLNIVSRLIDPNMRVDRIWERLTEIALFSRTKKHRAPAEILKAFIKAPKEQENGRLTRDELTKLQAVFKYLATAYRQVPSFIKSRFATDQPQFYTMVTLLLSTETMEKFKPAEFVQKLMSIRKILDGDIAAPKGMDAKIAEYGDASTKQTTHPARREKRQTILVELLG
jgi:uncharacterized protein with ParB-like and HNH nuclease domain